MDDACPLSVLLICADADVEFSWTEEDVANLYDNTTFIIAADGRSLLKTFSQRHRTVIHNHNR